MPATKAILHHRRVYEKKSKTKNQIGLLLYDIICERANNYTIVIMWHIFISYILTDKLQFSTKINKQKLCYFIITKY